MLFTAAVFVTSAELFNNPRYKNCSPPVVVVKVKVMVSHPVVFLVIVGETNKLAGLGMFTSVFGVRDNTCVFDK
ncbi:hypothetical protein D9M69_656940 [compost metagenome]